MRTHPSVRRLGAALVPLLFVAACGGGGSGGTPTEPGEPNPPPPPPQNKPPVVRIDAPEEEIMELSTVTLSATGSSDPDGDELSFTWEQTAGPTVLELSSTESDTISFKAPKVVEMADITFRISVADENGDASVKDVSLKLVEAEAIIYVEERATELEGSVVNSLWLLHPALEQPRLIGQAQPSDQPIKWSVSPDRRWVAWVENLDDNVGFHLTSLDGSTSVDLASALSEVVQWIGNLSWAQEGSTLLFTQDATFEGERELFRIDLPASSDAVDLLRLSPALVDENGDGNADESLDEFVVSPADDIVAMQFGGELLVSDMGGNVLRLSGTLRSIRNVQWSHDGKWLAFHAKTAADSPREVFIADPTAADSARSASGSIVGGGTTSEHRRLAWSPVDNNLAFAGWLRQPSDLELFVINADMEDPAGSRVAVSGEPAAGVFPVIFDYAWSPDGTRVAFTALGLENDVREVFISDMTSEPVQRTNVTGNRVTDGAVSTQIDPLWAADSRHLLFAGDLEVVDDNDMYLLSVEDQARRTVGTGGFCTTDENRFQFSPDSRFFTISCALEDQLPGPVYAFVTGSGNAVGDPVNLTGNGFDTNGDGVPDGDAFEFAWSPQTGRVIFTGRFSESHGFYELFEVSEETFGEPQRLLAAPDSQADILEFSIIGPYGTIDRR